MTSSWCRNNAIFQCTSATPAVAEVVVVVVEAVGAVVEAVVEAVVQAVVEVEVEVQGEVVGETWVETYDTQALGPTGDAWPLEWPTVPSRHGNTMGHILVDFTARWRHQMQMFSALLDLCEGNPPVTGGFPSQRSVTQSFDVFFDLRINKQLSKQSRPWGDLRRHRAHYDVTAMGTDILAT